MKYSQRLERETPTRFWVNNPTPSEAKAALDIGNVVGIATNANYLQRMLSMDETKDRVIATIDHYIREGVEDDHEIVALAAKKALSDCAQYFMPMFEESEGKYGWAAIQGNPNKDTDYAHMVSEAKRFYEDFPSIRVKFPATAEALKALETMTAAGKAALATCGFSVQYGIDAIEAYQRGVSRASGDVPQLFVTVLAGHVDEYFEKHIKAHGIDICEDHLAVAGCEFAKELYKIQQERYHDVNCSLLGGCRAPYHFSEMVPGNMHVTVNYDFIEKLNRLDLPIEQRIDQRTGDTVMQELFEKLPAYRYMLSDSSKDYLHWSLVPPALYFRNYVKKGWNNAAAFVRERRVVLD